MFPILLALQPLHFVLGGLMFVVGLFLCLLVLVQRGRGGGLAGAFGGMGGQSAFGTKAGDVFTRVTMVVAAVWILLCVLSVALLNSQTAGPLGPAVEPASMGEPAGGVDTPAENGTGNSDSDSGNSDSGNSNSGGGPAAGDSSSSGGAATPAESTSTTE